MISGMLFHLQEFMLLQAKERRDGKVEEQGGETDALGATAGYKAVAPDLKSYAYYIFHHFSILTEDNII